MAANVTFADAAALVGAGSVFLALSAGLGVGLARAGCASSDSTGPLCKQSAAVVAGVFALFVFAFTLALWWFGWFHPAQVLFYSAGGVILALTTRAKPRAAGSR